MLLGIKGSTACCSSRARKTEVEGKQVYLEPVLGKIEAFSVSNLHLQGAYGLIQL